MDCFASLAMTMRAMEALRHHSLANRHVTAATLIGTALRGRSVLEMAAPCDRQAAADIAHDLARGLRPGRAGLGPWLLPRRAIGAIVGIAACDRRFGAPLLAFIVV